MRKAGARVKARLKASFECRMALRLRVFKWGSGLRADMTV
jgi:hypothetical protein